MLRTCSGILAALAAFAVSAQAASKPPEDFRPGATLDLREFGYAVPKNFQERTALRSLHSLVFVDNKTLAVSLFVRNPNPGVSVRGKVLGGHYLFRTFFIDPQSGKLLRTETWSNSGIGCDLFPVSNGGFVVRHDLYLSLRASDGTPVKELELGPKDFPSYAYFKSSLSGNTLFAIGSDRQGEHILQIQATDLREVRRLHLDGYASDAFSDSQLVFLRQHRERDLILKGGVPTFPLQKRLDVFVVRLSKVLLSLLQAFKPARIAQAVRFHD